MTKIYIAGNLDPKDKGQTFNDIGQAINYLQEQGYSDKEICLVRFIPVK
ncbi:hypothetical protein Q5O24_12275 [Eubacteriaceae bacterium ES3]|nr:hypothetical protein Q5O24_12275 [Eubacteriaceae bacterium ES3]